MGGLRDGTEAVRGRVAGCNVIFNESCGLKAKVKVYNYKMAHDFGTEKPETRLTPLELETVLTRWRDEKENTVSVADVAEALHCSKAEIEALVWRARAEGVQKPRARPQVISVRRFMVLLLWAVPLLCLFASFLPGPTPQSTFYGLAGILFLCWTVYATV